MKGGINEMYLKCKPSPFRGTQAEIKFLYIKNYISTKETFVTLNNASETTGLVIKQSKIKLIRSKRGAGISQENL